jgi:arginine deiminase
VSVRVTSEVGELEAVVIHTPGPEIEAMTPKTAHEVLYNDIIPISVVRDEHRRLKEFLQTVTTVHEVSELLAEAFEDESARREVIRHVTDVYWCTDRENELLDLAPAELARTLISGLPTRDDSVTAYLSRRQYDVPPLPNLYFMRDSSVVFRDQVLIGAMAYEVRSTEAVLLKTAFTYAPALRNAGLLFDGTSPDRFSDGARRPGPPLRLEGGDVLVVRENLLVLGISERTSSSAVDTLVARIAQAWNEPVHVIAVILPEERSTIHLDMVFTMIDRDAALVYEPVIHGPDRREVVSLHVSPRRKPRIEAHRDLPEALEAAGVKLETVPCGGTDDVTRQREQWLSGTNVFAFAPGKIIGYDCNEATMSALASAGFEVRDVELFTSGRERVDDYERLFVAMPGINLARGGGGPRCMTLPVRRAPLSS